MIHNSVNMNNAWTNQYSQSVAEAAGLEHKRGI